MGNSNSADAPPGREVVYLNVYAASRDGMKMDHVPGFGIYHSGVQVYGTEWYFAGGNSDHSGINKQPPKWQPPGSPWLFQESIQVGTTNLTPRQIEETVQRLGKDFPANTYHLTSKNCNHFSDAFCRAITVKRSGIPGWVNRAARVGDRFKGFIDDPNDPMTGEGQGSAMTAEKEQPKRFDFASSKGQTLSETPVHKEHAEIAERLAKTAGSLEVDPDRPMASMRIVFHDRSKEVVQLNLDHTIGDLYAQVRSITPNLAPGKTFTLSTGFPPKPLLAQLQTIEEARLDRASIQQTIV